MQALLRHILAHQPTHIFVTMDFLERLVGEASGFSSLSVVICGACLILGTCFLPVLRMRDNQHTIGPKCRPDKPLDARKCVCCC